MGCGHKRGGRNSSTEWMPSHDSVVGKNNETILMPQIPEKCSNCGASIQPEKVKWVGPNCIECPYCGQSLTVHFEKLVS